MFALKSFRWVAGLALTVSVSVAFAVGPSRSNEYDEQTGKTIEGLPAITTSTKLSLVIPVFDPGLGDMPKPYHKDEKWEQVFDEVRRAEANMLAVKLREQFKNTSLFDKVRVAPTDQAIGELYVIGRIMRSNSEDLHLEIQAIDISQRRWLKKIYEVRVDEDDVSETARLRKIDPYQPLFAEVVLNVVEALAQRDESELRELRGIGDMVFASSYSQKTFASYLGEKKVRSSRNSKKRITVTTLEGMPAAGDSQYARIGAVRTKEELFLDDMQQHYDEFVGRVEPAYQDWQSDAFPLAVEARQARAKSTRRKVFAGLLAAGGAATGSEANEAKTAMIAGSAALAYGAFRASNEFKAISESMSELGESVNIQLAPTNIDFEGREQKLEGNAAKQYQDMRNFLRQVYAEEATPDQQLAVEAAH